MEQCDFPPQVMLGNIPPGYDHYYLTDTISSMIEDGHSKGLVDPIRIIVNIDHAFLHFDDVHDAARAQKHLNKYKFDNSILSAHLLVDENVDKALPEPEFYVCGKPPSDKDFVPMPPQEKKGFLKKGIKKSTGQNILNSIMKGLEGCDDFLNDKPVEANVAHFCVECGGERPHTIQECPSLRHKTRNSKCSYCLQVGHILFAKYPGVKKLICPVAIAKGSAFKY